MRPSTMRMQHALIVSIVSAGLGCAAPRVTSAPAKCPPAANPALVAPRPSGAAPADAADALEAVAARWMAMECRNLPNEVELEQFEHSWHVRFRTDEHMASTDWRFDLRDGSIEASTCGTFVGRGGPGDLTPFVRALRAALPRAAKHLRAGELQEITIARASGEWRVHFSEARVLKFGGGTIVLIDERSFQVIRLMRTQ